MITRRGHQLLATLLAAVTLLVSAHAWSDDLVLRREYVAKDGYYPFDIAVSPGGDVFIPCTWVFYTEHSYIWHRKGYSWSRISIPGHVGTYFRDCRTAFDSDGNLLVAYRMWSDGVLHYGMVQNGSFEELAEYSALSSYDLVEMIHTDTGVTVFAMCDDDFGAGNISFLRFSDGQIVDTGFDWSIGGDEYWPPWGWPGMAYVDGSIVMHYVLYPLEEPWVMTMIKRSSSNDGDTWSTEILFEREHDPYVDGLWWGGISRPDSAGQVWHAGIMYIADPTRLELFGPDGQTTFVHSQPYIDMRDNWDWGFDSEDVPYFLILTTTLPEGQWLWGSPGDVTRVLPAGHYEFDAHVTFDAERNSHFALNDNALYYARFVPPGLEVLPFLLRYASGTESGGELTTEERQNAVVYIDPGGEAAAYPVGDETLPQGEIDTLTDVFAGQFS